MSRGKVTETEGGKKRKTGVHKGERESNDLGIWHRGWGKGPRNHRGMWGGGKRWGRENRNRGRLVKPDSRLGGGTSGVQTGWVGAEGSRGVMKGCVSNRKERRLSRQCKQYIQEVLFRNIPHQFQQRLLLWWWGDIWGQMGPPFLPLVAWWYFFFLSLSSLSSLIDCSLHGVTKIATPTSCCCAVNRAPINWYSSRGWGCGN